MRIRESRNLLEREFLREQKVPKEIQNFKGI